MGWLDEQWQVLLPIATVVLGIGAAIHAAMTKDDVRAAIAWTGLVLLSPLLGASIYLLAGINRIKRSSIRRRRELRHFERDPNDPHGIPPERLEAAAGPQFRSMRVLGDRTAGFPLTDGNRVEILEGGDRTYAAMLEAIAGAGRSIALETYIFDDDAVGGRIADFLAAAQARGVEVRVLLDAIGSLYSRPPMTRRLRAAGVPTALFMGKLLRLRLPYANLRTHRKLLVVDGEVGFAGGMNIRAGFAGQGAAADTHFRFAGPVVAQFAQVFAEDWRFTTGERLGGPAWARPPAAPVGPALCRTVDSGPDEALERAHDFIMGALAVAQDRVRIASPYFLPDRALVAALAVAARRGLAVDILIPRTSNLRLVEWAITAQLDQVVRAGCRVWRAAGGFDHSKLMVVDGAWLLVGSSNLDPRSLRLNFELDVEIMDRASAARIESHIEQHIAAASPVTLESLAALPFPIRLRNRLTWLASPYL